MAAFPQIQVGVATNILQNVVYAMPARACVVSSSVVLEISMDGTTFVAMLVSAVGSSPLVAAPFIRCPSANAIVIAKPND
jgi:hypothetical protein